MTMGMKVWSPNSKVLLDTSWRVTRILGTIHQVGLNATGGSQYHALLPTGEFWWMFSSKITTTPLAAGNGNYPIVNAWVTGGSTFNWSCDRNGYSPMDMGSIIWGVY